MVAEIYETIKEFTVYFNTPDKHSIKIVVSHNDRKFRIFHEPRKHTPLNNIDFATFDEAERALFSYFETC